MNTKITFVELVDLMAEATSTSKRMCELFLREFFNTVAQALVDGENVKIKGIGTFKVTQVKSRKSTGENPETDLHNKLTFTPDKSLAEALNQPFAQFETVFLDDAVTDDKLDEIDRLYPSYFPETGEMPTPPDYPMPPIPGADQIPGPNQDAPIDKKVQPLAAKPEAQKSKPKTDEATKKDIKKEAEKPIEPVKKEIKKETEKPVEPVQKVKSHVKPLMGIPIDGPSTQHVEPAKAKPIPAPEPEEENDHFYRPAPHNAYTPTKEQLSQQQKSQMLTKNLRWLWAALGLIGAGLLIWLLTHTGGKADKATIAIDSDSVAAAVITEPDADSKTATEVKKEETAQVTKEAAVEPKKEEAKEAKNEAIKKPEPVEEAKPEVKNEPKEPAEAKPATDKSRVVTDVVTDKIVLVTLAEKYYGSPWFWVYIYEENRDKISNPNNIKPGTRVVIPPAEKYGIDAKNKASVKKAQRKSWEYLK